jgi:Mg2+/citrate symporter
MKGMKTSRLIVGAIFCAVAAFLCSMNFLAAAIYAQNLTSWSGPLNRFGAAYKEVGRELQVWAIVALIIGIIYMLLAEVQGPKDGDDSP